MPADVYAFCAECKFVSMPIVGASIGAVKKTPLFKMAELTEYSGLRRASLNVDLIKDSVYSDLKKDRSAQYEKQTPGTSNFPRDYAEEYYKMLTAESKVLAAAPKTGQPRVQWVKNHHRNEALDCRVYAYAARHIYCWHTCVNRWKIERVDYDRVHQQLAAAAQA